jgi:hypothetical protein
MNSPPPTAKQLRYLRGLAESRGESFAYPQSVAEASAEIERLKSRRPDTRNDRHLDRLAISRAMAARGDSAAVGENEVVGYGSSARWR